MASKYRISNLHKSVRAAGWVSLFTDFSSDMIYPLLPLFLKSVLGASTGVIGLIEGLAETTASLLKLSSGYLSDRFRRRKPLVLLGYTLSSLTRPLFAVAAATWHVLAIRIVDRIGKGIRTSPRDAMVADFTPPEARGFAFGYQRAMDNAGAIVGPLIASAMLWWMGHHGSLSPAAQLRVVFALAAIPGLLVPFIIWRFIEDSPSLAAREAAPARAAAAGSRDRLPKVYWFYLGAVLIFTLGNSSDAFLVLRANEAGIPEWEIPLLWAAFHCVKAGGAVWGGRLSDLWGRKSTLFIGWAIYAASYVLFGFAAKAWQCWAIFLFYGLYYNCVEATERAVVADLVPAGLRGTAYGIFHAVVGIAALPASVMFGLVWKWAGHPLPPFLMGAGLAVGAAVALAFIRFPSRSGA